MDKSIYLKKNLLPYLNNHSLMIYFIKIHRSFAVSFFHVLSNLKGFFRLLA